MTLTSAVPFVIRRVHGVVKGREVTATKEDSHGVLRLESRRLVAQWSTAREFTAELDLALADAALRAVEEEHRLPSSEPSGGALPPPSHIGTVVRPPSRQGRL